VGSRKEGFEIDKGGSSFQKKVEFMKLNASGAKEERSYGQMIGSRILCDEIEA